MGKKLRSTQQGEQWSLLWKWDTRCDFRRGCYLNHLGIAVTGNASVQDWLPNRGGEGEMERIRISSVRFGYNENQVSHNLTEYARHMVKIPNTGESTSV